MSNPAQTAYDECMALTEEELRQLKQWFNKASRLQGAHWGNVGDVSQVNLYLMQALEYIKTIPQKESQ